MLNSGDYSLVSPYSPSISSLHFLNVVKTFERMGFDNHKASQPILENMQDFKNPRYRVPLDRIAEVLDIVGDQLALENIGLETAFKLRVTTMGDAGSVLANCKSLAEAGKFHVKYAVLSEAVALPEFQRREDGIFVTWHEQFLDHERYRHVTELLLGGYIVTTNWMSWSFEKGVKSVSLRHKAPADLSRHEAIFKCPVYFEQDENNMELYPECADLPLPNANPEVIEHATKVFDRVKESFLTQSPMEIEAFGIIKKAIQDDNLSAANVAKVLHISERTFRRRLSEKGKTYRGLVDRVRQSMCRSYMRENLRFTEIAQLLGYNDQSAFNRAFKKWYGTAPGQYKVIDFTI
jgi:AraC-like DNA-binding protein